LWSLALLYFGARYALQGKWWSSLLVVILWVLVVTVAPIVSGDIDASIDEPTSSGTIEMFPGMMDEFDESLPDDIGDRPEIPERPVPGGAFAEETPITSDGLSEIEPEVTDLP
jgi:hypothetical protein